MSSAIAGRRIVLGVTGGIAAYKAIEVCRRLVDAGAHVMPVMTAGRRAFRRSQPRFRRLRPSRCRPRCGTTHDPIPHTHLGQSADLIVVAPATARLIGAYAAGISSRSADRDAARHPGSGGASARRCTPRCGNTRPCRTTWPRCAAAACTWSNPTTGRLAGGDVGKGGSPRRSESSPKSSVCSAPAISRG